MTTITRVLDLIDGALYEFGDNPRPDSYERLIGEALARHEARNAHRLARFGELYPDYFADLHAGAAGTGERCAAVHAQIDQEWDQLVMSESEK